MGLIPALWCVKQIAIVSGGMPGKRTQSLLIGGEEIIWLGEAGLLFHEVPPLIGRRTWN